LRLRLEEPEEITPETGPHPLAGLRSSSTMAFRREELVLVL